MLNANNMMQKILTPLLLLSVGICLGMMLMRSCIKPKEITTEIIKTDTLTIVKVDTIRIVQPQAVKIMRDTVKITDTILIAGKITDTILIAGQTFFQEIKEYRDSTYYARVSGINAFLEEIRVYPKTTTKYITTMEYVREKQKRWGLGPQVGVGVVDNRIHTYIGFGIHYNIVQW